MRLLRTLLLASCLLVVATPALAAIAQTITVDGVNDFDPSNLITDDRYDTARYYCSPDSVFPLDLGRAYLTNDNNYLYVGFDWPHKWGCYDNSPGPNLGIAIDVNTVAGGTSDPFSRKIGWTNLTNRPDFVVYDVPSVPGNTYHYQILYKWTGSAWSDSTRLVTGSGAGPNALGMVDTSGFVELKLPLSALGVSSGSNLNVEWWYTQDGTNKGPLDAVMSDGVQMSLFPSHTTWDTTAVVQMTTMAPYTVLAYSDAVPPTVTQAVATGFTLDANKQFVVTSNKIDVTFSEPVSQTTANTAGNYAFGGPVSRTVILATRDASATNVVHLVLNSALSANAAFDNITVTNVKDLAGNTIVANGSTNVGSFFIQNLVFSCDPGVALCRGTFSAADTFSVEGSLSPLTFETLCDNAMMYDGDADHVWTTTVPFAMPKGSGGKAEADLEYKYVHQCRDYDSGANRTYHLSSDNGASVTLTDYWNREDPANYIAHPIDVVFQVNAALISPTAADTVYLQGNESPLGFTPSGVAMRDDGVSPDLTAGDMIYTAQVRFPKCTYENLEWKVFYRGAFECTGQGNRTAWLNDAAYDTVGGAMGPLWLPARGIERCSVTDKPITVLFRVYTGAADPLPATGDTLAVMGDVAPLSFSAPPPSVAWLNDSKSGGDAAAGDQVWTAGVTFPDSSQVYVHYKFWWNSTFECYGMDNRWLVLDDLNHSTTTPQRPDVALWDFCSTPVSVDPSPISAGAEFAVLRQSYPNPMSPRTMIHFDLRRAGAVKLAVYDITGRRVNLLMDRTLQPGPYEIQWDGRDADGRLLRSGIYLYELTLGRDRLSRRLVLTR
jgi:hypothetical protein